MERHRVSAKRLLLHYFELAGVVTHSDNRVEIHEIVDIIFDGVESEVDEKINALRRELLDPTGNFLRGAE